MKRLLSRGAVLGVALLLAGCSAALISDTDGNNNNNPIDPGLGAVQVTQDPYTRATITWTEPEGTTGYELRVCEAGDAAPTWNECPPAAEQPTPCGENQVCEQVIPNLGLKTYRAYLSYKVGSNRSEPAVVDIDARFKLARYRGTADSPRLGGSLALGDLDDDGNKDLAVAGFGTPAGVVVFKGGRDFLRSTAGLPVSMARFHLADMAFAGIQIGDLTCDGSNDLLINGFHTDAWVTPDSITWSGELDFHDFFRIGGFALGQNPHLPAIADLLGSGCPELVMGYPAAANIFGQLEAGELDHIVGGIAGDIGNFGNPASGFAVLQGGDVETHLGYYAYGVGDVDGNGQEEVVFAEQYNYPHDPIPNVSLKFLAHDGANYVALPEAPDYLMEFNETRTYATLGGDLGTFAGPLGDINDDGIGDFYISYLTADPGAVISVFLGQRDDLGWRPADFTLESADLVDKFGAALLSESFGAGGLAADDFDHDGSVELLAGSLERIYVFRYNEETLDYEPGEILNYPCIGIQVWDFNQDAYNDILCGNLDIGASGAADFRY